MVNKTSARASSLDRGPPRMHGLMNWIYAHGNMLAVMATIGVAVLVVCCLECVKCPKCEKDDLFRKRSV